MVRTRVQLRSPFGETVVRDIEDGRWADPHGEADSILGRDMWALPGLVDAHSHLAAAQLDYQPGDLAGAMGRARDALRAGVTLVLDKGWREATAVEVMRSVPEVERPDIEAAARIITTPGGYFPGFGLEVDAAGIPAAVADQAAAAAGWVKLIGDWPRKGLGPVANFTADELVEVVGVAQKTGSRVAIHTMAREVPSAAVAAGVHSIEHGLFLTSDDIDALGKRRGMWVPTVLRVEETIAQLGVGSSGARLLSEGLANMKALLPMAQEAGVNVLAGTDLIGTPSDVAAEAIRLGECGLTELQVVQAVARAGFLATGRSATFELGTPANAVLFDANPAENLPVLGYPSVVIRLGTVR